MKRRIFLAAVVSFLPIVVGCAKPAPQPCVHDAVLISVGFAASRVDTFCDGSFVPSSTLKLDNSLAITAIQMTPKGDLLVAGVRGLRGEVVVASGAAIRKRIPAQRYVDLFSDGPKVYASEAGGSGDSYITLNSLPTSLTVWDADADDFQEVALPLAADNWIMTFSQNHVLYALGENTRTLEALTLHNLQLLATQASVAAGGLSVSDAVYVRSGDKISVFAPGSLSRRLIIPDPDSALDWTDINSIASDGRGTVFVFSFARKQIVAFHGAKEAWASTKIDYVAHLRYLNGRLYAAQANNRHYSVVAYDSASGKALGTLENNDGVDVYSLDVQHF